MNTIGKAAVVVGPQHLAPVLKTGCVKVMSTAIMAALMEEASCTALTNANVKKASVGVALSLTHKKPSAPGAHVYAVSKITDLNQKSIAFEVEAFDETGLIGTATHKRVFIDQDSFEKKCYENARKAQNKNK